MTSIRQSRSRSYRVIGRLPSYNSMRRSRPNASAIIQVCFLSSSDSRPVIRMRYRVSLALVSYDLLHEPFGLPHPHPPGDEFRQQRVASAARVRDSRTVALSIPRQVSAAIIVHAGYVHSVLLGRRHYRDQQSKRCQHFSLRSRWSSMTKLRIASGSCARCHRHSLRPASSFTFESTAARAALMAYAAAPSS